jgi:hypothetical protein
MTNINDIHEGYRRFHKGMKIWQVRKSNVQRGNVLAVMKGIDIEEEFGQ